MMEWLKLNRKQFCEYLLLEMSFLVFSFSAVFAKKASAYELFTIEFASYFMFFGVVMAVYAVLWQQVLKRFSLTTAYSNRVSMYFWILIWSVIFFKEVVTLFNIAGLMIICAGIIMVSRNV